MDNRCNQSQKISHCFNKTNGKWKLYELWLKRSFWLVSRLNKQTNVTSIFKPDLWITTFVKGYCGGTISLYTLTCEDILYQTYFNKTLRVYFTSRRGYFGEGMHLGLITTLRTVRKRILVTFYDRKGHSRLILVGCPQFRDNDCSTM